MKCPECGKNMVVWATQGIYAQKFEWKCRCKDKQWESEEEKEIFRQLWGEVNPLPCPDCDGTGHIRPKSGKKLEVVEIPFEGSLRIYAGPVTAWYRDIKHCPRCKGSGEVVQDAH